MDLGFTSVAAITVICYLVAEIVKDTRLDKKWIPAICGMMGAVLGIAGMHLMPAFPASDYLNAAAVGIVSGFAATGVHQALKQMDNK
ncbi:MAG: phage holin family protein [Oscillospiraceae bacterium]|nr:phage holin family protein [Oscillospiraceae bacterium]